ncbi:MAG TPA: hypothetical protein DCX67_08355 [Opitutae bacterium]|nr:hypothetical protein [Opitutae bacterium]
MKIFPLALFSLFLLAGCSSEEDTPGGGSQALVMKYPEPLAGIIAQAVDADELDDTQPKDDYVFRTQYMPNERTPKSGWIKRIFEGKVTLLAEVKDGALNGRSIVFEQGGAKWKEFTLKNGNYEGTYTEFQADGSKKFECSYVDGKENGSWKHWHNNSLLAEERVYQDGQASGPFALYHTNGNKAMEGAYQAGERHGPFTKWHSNKIKEAEGT